MYVPMGKEITVQNLHEDLDRVRRAQNLGTAMVSTDLNRVNKNLIGSTALLYSQIGSLSLQNTQGFNSLVASTEGLRSDIAIYSDEISSSLNQIGRNLSREIQNATAKLQVSIENLGKSIGKVNEELVKIRKESEHQTIILKDINEGIHKPENQKIANGIEEFNNVEYKASEQSFNQALEIKLSSFLAHYYLACIYMDEKEIKTGLYNEDKAISEMADAIFYGEKRIDENEDVRSYMIIAHQRLSDLYFKKGALDKALDELGKGISISKDKKETKIMYVQQYVHCYHALGDKSKAMEYVRLGLDDDVTYLVLLCDPCLEDLQDDILKIVEECSYSFSKVIEDLCAQVKDVNILNKINESISDVDAKTYLGRHKILSMLRGTVK